MIGTGVGSQLRGDVVDAHVDGRANSSVLTAHWLLARFGRVIT